MQRRQEKVDQKSLGNLSFRSIFDPSQDLGLWEKVKGKFDPKDLKPHIRSSKFEKKCRRFSSFEVSRFYSLYDKWMVYGTSSNPSHPKKCLSLEGLKVRVDCSKTPFKSQQKLVLDFYRSNKSFQLIVKDPNLLEEWKNHLKEGCIMLDFEQNYVIKNVIGEGAEAKVFLAESLSEGKKYAVKTFDKTKLSVRLQQFRTLLEEIKAVRNFRHKNIVKFHEVYESETNVHLVMEYLEAGNLEVYLQKKICYKEKDALTLLNNILKALIFLHEKGVIHRDLKPSNIMLSSLENDTEIKLIDFGHSSEVKCVREHSIECGTPGYIAPELLLPTLASKIDYKCDVFSAGVIFYELLSGRKLFEGCSHGEIYRLNKACAFDLRNLQQKPVSIESIELLKKMLEWDPEKRLTAQEALEFVLKQRIITCPASFVMEIDAFEKTIAE